MRTTCPEPASMCSRKDYRRRGGKSALKMPSRSSAEAYGRIGISNALFKPRPRLARGIGVPAPRCVDRRHHVALDPAAELVLSNASELCQKPLLLGRAQATNRRKSRVQSRHLSRVQESRPAYCIAGDVVERTHRSELRDARINIQGERWA